jgi:hypothetical protein
MPVVPIAWSARAFDAFVAGEPVRLPQGAPSAEPMRAPEGAWQPGSPRSPDGKTLVLPTSRGLLVRGDKTKTIRARELDGKYGDLVGCTVADDTLTVACVLGRRAFLATTPE